MTMDLLEHCTSIRGWEMPEAFKGHYTLDEDGKLIELRNPNEVKEMLNNFFASKNSLTNIKRRTIVVRSCRKDSSFLML